MGLVDYSSSSSSSPSPSPSPSSSEEQVRTKHSPARKKRKLSSTKPPSSPLPPLPASFHDLYASTVRTTTNDDPSLHQGRRRLIPHVAGNWPSHIYVEWHPTAQQHALLTGLLDDLRSTRSSLSNDDDGGLLSLSSSSSSETANSITSFLTSDLGSPLPLHISLSRPIVLRTEERDAFLEQITDALRGWHPSGSNSKRSFDLGVHELSWHRSPDSDRSFLVLRVRSSNIVSSSPTANTSTRNGGDDDDDPADGRNLPPSSPRGEPIIINPELETLLNRCNNVVAQYGQPRLYSRGRRRQSSNGNNHLRRYSSNSSNNKNTVTTDAAIRDANSKNVEFGTNKEDENENEGDIDQTAFHVSIAWSFAKPTAAIQERTAAIFKQTKFQQGILGSGEGGGGEGIKIPVESVKVKIGNVVTSIPLTSSASTGARDTTTATRRTGDTGRGLFGI